MERNIQCSVNRSYRAIESKLTQYHVFPQPLGIDRTRGSEQAECDRQIERTALLADVRRGQIDCDLSVCREGDRAVLQRREHALLALAYCRVRQPNDRKTGYHAFDMRFDLDGKCFNSLGSSCIATGEHLT